MNHRSLAMNVLLSLFFVGKGDLAASDIFPDFAIEAFPKPLTEFAEYAVDLTLKNPVEARTRFDFENVSVSLPSGENIKERMKNVADVSLILKENRFYEFLWLDGEDPIAGVSFPASFDLINNTDQVKSYEKLKDGLISLTQMGRVKTETKGITDIIKENVETENGTEFYLGNFNRDTFRDKDTHLPVWSVLMPAESMANLFIADPLPADPELELSLINYEGKEETVKIFMSQLRKVMEDLGCVSYFGISEIENQQPGEGVVIYHNPLFAYIHKITVDITEEAFKDVDAKIKGTLLPYIKLHNVKNLWGEKIIEK